MITVSCIATLLFLGGWNAPFGLTFVPGIVWFCIKVGLFMFMYIWLRATLPRFRYDRLMAFGWKVLLPVATLNLMVTAAVVAAMRISVCEAVTERSARCSPASATTFSSSFKKKPTIAVSAREEAARAALSRFARTAPLRGRQGALHRLRAVPDRLPGQRHHGDRRREHAGRPAFAGRALRGALRDRRVALHFLRHVRRGVPDRRDRADAALRDGRLSPRLVHLCQGPAAGARPKPASASRRTSVRTAFPADLGRVAEQKSTVDIDAGYGATWRGDNAQDARRKGLAADDRVLGAGGRC